MRYLAVKPANSGWWSSVQGRRRTYAAMAVLLFVMAGLAGAAKAKKFGRPFDLTMSDGRYYYAHLASVVIDGDLDFSNQIREHWEQEFSQKLSQDRTEIGRVRNKYPIGLALTLLPAFWLGHLIALLSGGWIPANGYSWPYQLACLAMVELLVWRTLVRVDSLLIERLRVPAGAAKIGLMLLTLGTPYTYYAFREPFMVHAASAFWCMEVVAAAAMGHRGPRWLWPRLAFAGAMALVCRPANIHLVPVAAYGVAEAVRAQGWRRTLATVPLTGTAVVPVGLQLLCWRLIFGHWVFYTYGKAEFYWFHPALWETLFSSRHGLFFWSPVLLLAVAALWHRARDPLVQYWALGGALLWYANSAWHSWWFGDAYGARAFLELAGLFGIGLGLLFETLGRVPKLAMALVLLVLVFNWVLMALYITERIPRGDYLLP